MKETRPVFCASHRERTAGESSRRRHKGTTLLTHSIHLKAKNSGGTVQLLKMHPEHANACSGFLFYKIFMEEYIL